MTSHEARSHGAWVAVTLAANQTLALDATTGAITLTTTYSDAIRTQVFPATASTTLAGDQAFAFIGTAAFSHTAGELRLAVSHGSAKLMADTNGDGVADMAIALDHVTSLTAADLVL